MFDVLGCVMPWKKWRLISPRCATDADREILRCRFAELEEIQRGVREPQHDAVVDASFHLAIADASHNVALIHVMRGFVRFVVGNIGRSLERLYTRESSYAVIHAQHQAILKGFWIAIQMPLGRLPTSISPSSNPRCASSAKKTFDRNARNGACMVCWIWSQHCRSWPRLGLVERRGWGWLGCLNGLGENGLTSRCWMLKNIPRLRER